MFSRQMLHSTICLTVHINESGTMPKKAIWSHKWGKLSNEQVLNVFLPSGITLDSMATFKPGCFQIVCMLFLSFFKQILLAMLKKLCFKQTEGYFKKVITISVSTKGRLALYLMSKWCKNLKNNTWNRKSRAVKDSVVSSLINGLGVIGLVSQIDWKEKNKYAKMAEQLHKCSFQTV